MAYNWSYWKNISGLLIKQVNSKVFEWINYYTTTNISITPNPKKLLVNVRVNFILYLGIWEITIYQTPEANLVNYFIAKLRILVLLNYIFRLASVKCNYATCSSIQVFLINKSL